MKMNIVVVVVIVLVTAAPVAKAEKVIVVALIAWKISLNTEYKIRPSEREKSLFKKRRRRTIRWNKR